MNSPWQERNARFARSDAKYNGMSEYHFAVNKRENTETHEQLEFLLVGQGTVPDSHVREDFDLRFDANGDVTKAKTVFTSVCK